MKLSTALIGAITAAVITTTSCKKKDEMNIQPIDDAGKANGEVINPNPNYCPACGMG